MAFYSRTETSSDSWETPKEFYDKLDALFHFTLDPCATDANHKCAKYYTEAQDGLKQSWKGEIVFVNPPFKSNAEWLEKCKEESKDATIVVVIPPRTDTRYWHDIVLPNSAEVWFCDGRVNFLKNGQRPKGGATFPLLVIVFKPHEGNIVFKGWKWK